MLSLHAEHEAASAYPAPYAFCQRGNYPAPPPHSSRSLLLVNKQFLLGQKLRNNLVIALILIGANYHLWSAHKRSMVMTDASARLKHLDLLSVHRVKSITCMLSTRLRLRAPPSMRPMRGNYPAPPPHSSCSFVASQQAVGTEAEKQFSSCFNIDTKDCIDHQNLH